MGSANQTVQRKGPEQGLSTLDPSDENAELAGLSAFNPLHALTKCTCGVVIPVCRCFDPDQSELVIEAGCPECTNGPKIRAPNRTRSSTAACQRRTKR